MKIPDPYDRTQHRGVLLDYATAAASVCAEIDLGYRLTIIQGVGGAAASKGAHLGKGGIGGRAIDCAPYDGARKERVFRDVGFAAYEREELPGVWSPHVHAGLMFISRDNAKGAADVLFRQFASYDAGRDALVDDLPDPHPYRPSPKVNFSLERYEHVMRGIGLDGGPLPTRITKIRDALVREDYDLGLIVALMKGEPETDEIRRDVKKLQRDRVEIRAMLERMPKR